MNPDLTRRALIGGLGGLTAGAVLVPDLRSFVLAGFDEGPPIYTHVPVLGTRLSIAVRHSDTHLAQNATRAAIGAVFDVHQTMTLHEPSPLTFLNDHGLEADVPVPELLWTVLGESHSLNRETGGLFDATLGHLLTGQRARTGTAALGCPDHDLATHLDGVGWDKVLMDETRRTVRLTHPSTALDFNGIAKGYAVDQAARVLYGAGLEHFLINAGGDLFASGVASPGAAGWSIHLSSTQPGEPPLKTFEISGQAVATSGNVFQRKGAHGGPVAHLLHPGMGVPSGDFVTATAIAPTAMEADAWATAAFVGSPTALASVLPSRQALEIHLVDGTGGIHTLVG